MKITFTERILEYLQAQAESAVDWVDIMTSSRPVSYRKARHSLLRGAPEFKHDWADMYRKRQEFYSLLNCLKRDGLVVRKKENRGSPWSITGAGRKKLVALKEKREKSPDLPDNVYERKEGSSFVVVAFDVPEQERKKRDWLRMNLKALGLDMLQQSVWVGKVRIPEDFVRDLRKSNMISYVHIFSVNKSGSMVQRV